MEVKVIEVRDRATFKPVIALKVAPENERERYLLARSGYGTESEEQNKYIILMNSRKPFNADYSFYDVTPGSTMQVIWLYLIDHWDEVEPGQVLDAEYLRGESDNPKQSESVGFPM